jgi:hypothetical protein
VISCSGHDVALLLLLVCLLVVVLLLLKMAGLSEPHPGCMTGEPCVVTSGTA